MRESDDEIDDEIVAGEFCEKTDGKMMAQDAPLPPPGQLSAASLTAYTAHCPLPIGTIQLKRFKMHCKMQCSAVLGVVLCSVVQQCNVVEECSVEGWLERTDQIGRFGLSRDHFTLS